LEHPGDARALFRADSSHRVKHQIQRICNLHGQYSDAYCTTATTTTAATTAATAAATATRRDNHSERDGLWRVS
jgi:hypothetical protein